MRVCPSGRRATIMGIGTAVPPNVVLQSSFPDYYFETTNSNHMVDLKAKFVNICEKAMIEKRHLYMSDEFIRSNPSITAYKSPSLNLRQGFSDASVPRLGVEAARCAITDWGRQVSEITRLVFCTTASGCMPGADFELVKLLDLPLSTRRFMLYQVGCHGGGMSLRLAKNLAENNHGARVLVVCSEVITMAFRSPSESHIGNLVGQAIFGDAAGAIIVGADPIAANEIPLFEIVSASQDIIPDTEEMVVAKLYEDGIVCTLHRDVAHHISTNIGGLVRNALEHATIVKDDWNKELFWLVHPGGRSILGRVESTLGLREEKLEVSRKVMAEHGNTLSSCVIVAMDKMRKRSEKRRLPTAGEGLEWGLLFSLGPGLTVETILLRAVHNQEPSV